MTIKVSVHKKSKSVLLDVPRQTRKRKKGIGHALHEIGVLVGRENKKIITTGKRTGRTYTIRGKRHVASAPGEAPANRTGRLVKSYDYKVSGWHTMKVGEEAPYAKFLEDGTRPMGGRMGARQHLIKAVNNKSGDSVRAFYRYGKKAIGA